MEVEVPSFFLCPISLQIMRDPVTLPTGITYDRDNIERWIFSVGQKTCPATTQPLPDCPDLTPNHTLRRLTQSWCAANAFLGVERFPTPRPPLTHLHLSSLLDQAAGDPLRRLPCLQKLARLISDSDRNKRFVAAAAADTGILDFLAAAVSSEDEQEQDEAVGILHSLQLPEPDLHLLLDRHRHLVDSLTMIMQRSSPSRSHAIMLIKSLLSGTQPFVIPESLFDETVKVLKDRVSYQATKAAMQILSGVCLWGMNTEKAAAAGAAEAIIELLLDEAEKRVCEMALIVLDDLCRCRKGREAVVRHAAGLAVVSKKMMRVTPVATKRAVRILYSIARNTAAPAVLRDMVEAGAVAKLCLLMSLDCGKSTTEMAAEILRMHSRFWRNLPNNCVPPAQLKLLNL